MSHSQNLEIVKNSRQRKSSVIMENLCLSCEKSVSSRQQALLCEGCERWCHRTCGTNITQQHYRQAVREERSIDWKCDSCSCLSSFQFDPDIHSTPVENMQDLSVDQEATHSIYAEISIPDTTPDEIRMERLIAEESHSNNMGNCQDDDAPQQEYQPLFMDIDEPTINDPPPRELDGPSTDEPLTFKVIEQGTTKGKPKLVDSRGYSYNFWRQRGNTKNWQCTVRPKLNKCPAIVTEKDDGFHLGLKDHNHSPNVDAATTAEVVKEIKKRATSNFFKPATAIVEEVLMEEISGQPCPSLPKIEYLARAANKARQSQRPKDPVDLNFSLDENHIPPAFYQGEVKVKQHRHLLFASSNQLELLSTAKTYYIDGTFKLCRHPFVQLFSISAFVKHDDHAKQVPLMFVLMSRRKKSDYKKVLEKVKDLTPNAVVKNITADFEKAAWRALRIVYPEVKITGCVFHWTQALWRKVQALGLQVPYQTDDGTFKFIRRCMALPFLPVAEIEQQFTILQSQATTTQLTDFVNYIDNTWLKGSTWPPTTWSVFGMPVRTNNDVEGWHNALNRRASGKCQLPFYLFIELLHQEAKLVQLQVRLVSEKKLRRIQRKKYRVLQGKIFNEWDQFQKKEKTASQLLKACSRLNGPVVRQQ